MAKLITRSDYELEAVFAQVGQYYQRFEIGRSVENPATRIESMVVDIRIPRENRDPVTIYFADGRALLIPRGVTAISYARIKKQLTPKPEAPVSDTDRSDKQPNGQEPIGQLSDEDSLNAADEDTRQEADAQE